VRYDTRFRLPELVAVGLAAFAPLALAQSASADAFGRLQGLAGAWEADSPAGGKLTSTMVLVSKGTAIEETIGTPAENEVSLYTRAGGRIVMTHYCALTAEGNQVRLEARVTAASQDEFVFSFAGATNLGRDDPHMRRMVLRLRDASHFSEVWTMRKKGKDTVFTLDFARK